MFVGGLRLGCRNDLYFVPYELIRAHRVVCWLGAI